MQGHPDLASPEYVSWESPRSTSDRRQTDRQTWTLATVQQMVTISHVCMYVLYLYLCIFVCCIDVYLYVHVYLYDEVVNAVEMNSPHVRKLCTNTFMNL